MNRIRWWKRAVFVPVLLAAGAARAAADPAAQFETACQAYAATNYTAAADGFAGLAAEGARDLARTRRRRGPRRRGSRESRRGGRRSRSPGGQP